MPTKRTHNPQRRGDPQERAMSNGVEPLLVAEGLGKRFGALVVLDGVDFSVKPGEAVGIVGPNGAGKTTLLNILAGSQRPNAGRVTFRGSPITSASAAARSSFFSRSSHRTVSSYAANSDPSGINRS